MAINTIHPEIRKQWHKPMVSFYDYLPMKYKATSQRDWNIRRMIWEFKDGKSCTAVAIMTASKLREHFGEQVKDIVFACVPASNEAKNELRYKDFTKTVCHLSGAINAYEHIRIEGERLAVHERKEEKALQSVQVISFDVDFFKGKRVLVFDDILTKGFSYARFACQLEKFGAVVVGGFFLGKTICRNY